MEVKITFADGTEINATKNGDSYIVDEKFEATEEQLSEVTITEEETEIALYNTELIECWSNDGKYWFTLHEIPQEVEDRIQLRADVDYLLAIV